jgi:hypothetical protein
VLEAAFVLLEFSSPSRRIFIGSQSLPPLWFAISVLHQAAPTPRRIEVPASYCDRPHSRAHRFVHCRPVRDAYISGGRPSRRACVPPPLALTHNRPPCQTGPSCPPAPLGATAANPGPGRPPYTTEAPSTLSRAY